MNKLNISFDISVEVPHNFSYNFFFNGLIRYLYKRYQAVGVFNNGSTYFTEKCWWVRLDIRNRFFKEIFT